MKTANNAIATQLMVVIFACLFIHCPTISWGNDSPILPANTTESPADTIVRSGKVLNPRDNCPSWMTVIDRSGWDGGHLTVQLDSCECIEYTLYSRAQDAMPGFIANLEPDDVFIEWDEDPGDGSRGLFEFTGDYVLETPPYIQVSGDSVTNWTVFRVITSGSLSKTVAGYNEHEAIHLQRNLFDLEKSDGLADPNQCAEPGDELQYTITWHNTTDQAVENCWGIDWLPPEVNYDPVISTDPLVADPNYNPEEHYYIWDIGTINANESGSYTINVTVNQKAAPGSSILNTAEIYSDDALAAKAIKITNICCWDTTDPNIIFADSSATGLENGTCWEDAYTNLQAALDRARNSKCAPAHEIHVARGSYNPGPEQSTSFVLPQGISVYGGFRSGGSLFDERNPDKYPTILHGQVDADIQNNTIVTMGPDTRIDGFVIRDAALANITAGSVDFTVENCTVSNSLDKGIDVINSNIGVKWCDINNNGGIGIYHEGQGQLAQIENSRIEKNAANGVYSRNSALVITNSFISNNGFSGVSADGVHVALPNMDCVLYNNTIIHNTGYAVSFMGDKEKSDPNVPLQPNIQNCIMWYNNNDNDDGKQIFGFNQDLASYSCIQDCNEVNNNWNFEPGFAYPDPNNLHLAYNSPCRDKGNPEMLHLNQYDIDGENRLYNGRVDIGADEIYACDEDLTEDDISSPLDINFDGVINYTELTSFARAWLSHEPNSLYFPVEAGTAASGGCQNWNPIWNLIDTGSSTDYIDLADLAEFAENGWWMWEACWHRSRRERFLNHQLACPQQSALQDAP
jgi:uncharacterized repeat protein (TIGR01451 family)